MVPSVGHSKRKVVPFTNKKLWEKVPLNRSKVQKIPSISPNCNIFVNENLNLSKSKMVFFVENLKVQITSTKHLQEMVWYLGQILK